METLEDRYLRIAKKPPIMRMLVDTDFRVLRKFKDDVGSYCSELDEKQRESIRAAIEKIEDAKVRELAQMAQGLPETRSHISLLYESLALMTWHQVEQRLMQMIALRGNVTQRDREEWVFRHIGAYYKGAGHPLDGMPQSNKVFELSRVANSIKHRAGRASSKLVPKYANEAGQRIRLTSAHLDEWLSACPDFLRAVIEVSLDD